jgi:hypothetical protein
MNETRELLQRAQREFPPPERVMESLSWRRDRKRRNQRIAAGVVGLAVFVAGVVLIMGTVGLSDRSQRPAGGVETGSTETGPTETGPGGTGPKVTGPVIGPTGDPYSVGFRGLPPEGATPSEPLRGELVMSDGGIHPYYAVNVYADGRLIWARDAVFTGEFVPTPPPEGGPVVSEWIEQRLTPEGVELLRTGAVELGGQFENPGEQLPVSAWEDPELRPYVPSTYAACLYGGFELPSESLDPLPPWAQDLLRRADRAVEGLGCKRVSIEDARAIVKILSDHGFEVGGDTGWVGAVSAFKGSGFGSFHFKGSGIEFVPLLPDGAVYETGG